MGIESEVKQQEEIAKIKKADASVKAMEDFTCPEVLYGELISGVKKYHPSRRYFHD